MYWQHLVKSTIDILQKRIKSYSKCSKHNSDDMYTAVDKLTSFAIVALARYTTKTATIKMRLEIDYAKPKLLCL